MNRSKNILSINHKAVLAFAACLLFVLAGCKVHYGLSGATIPPEAKTVCVQYFQNTASLAPPTLQQTFTEALRDKMAQTRLANVNKGGDLTFEGSITGYNTTPVALQSTDVSALNRLTITVNVKYTCAFDEKKNFEQTFTRYADYDSKLSLTSVEATLIADINEQLTQDIFNRALNDW